MERFYVIHNTPIFLGRPGENNARQAAFDLAPWRELYGPGSVQLMARRSGETVMYPVPLTLEGDLAVWTITAADAAKVGQTGECELTYIPDADTLVKSETWTTFVLPAMEGSVGEVPDEAAAWFDALRQQTAANERIAERAALSATEAAQSAGTAGGRASAAAKSAAEAESARRAAQDAADRAEAAAIRQPYPDEETGTWWVWDAEAGAYKDSGGSYGGSCASFETDETLKLQDGVLSVNTTNEAEKDNTLPITSAGVHTQIGNIEVLLKTI